MADNRIFPVSLPTTALPMMDLSPLQGMTAASLKIDESFTALGETMNVKGYSRVIYDKANNIYIGLVEGTNHIIVVDGKTKLMICSFLYAYSGCGDAHYNDEAVDMVLHSTITNRPRVEDHYYPEGDGTNSLIVDGQAENVEEEGKIDSGVLEPMNATVAEALIRAAACDYRYYAEDGGRITLTGTKQVTPRRIIEISFLAVNKKYRTAYIVRMQLDLNQPYPMNEERSRSVLLTDRDMTAMIEIVPRGTAHDVISVPNSELTYNIPMKALGGTILPRYTYRHVNPDVEKLIPMLKDRLYLGEYQDKYCGLALSDGGQYFILLGAKTLCWVTPLISCYVYTQYLFTIDEAALGLSCTYIGPLDKAFAWNEIDKSQPFYHSPSIYDGRYLLMQYDVKSRALALQQTRIEYPHSVGPTAMPDYLAYIGTTDWGGGYVDGVLFPARQALRRIESSDGGSKIIGVDIWYGYPDTWDDTAEFDPVYRESYWVRIKIDDIKRNMPIDEFVSKLQTQPISLHYDVLGSPLTIYGTEITYAHGAMIAHGHLNYVVFFEEGPNATRYPMDSIYFSGIIPGKKMTKMFKVKNISENGTVENLRLCMAADDIPQGVTLSISNFPETLTPQQEAFFSVELSYEMTQQDCEDCPYADSMPTPPVGEEGNTYKCCCCPVGEHVPMPSVDISLHMMYYMAWYTPTWSSMPSVVFSPIPSLSTSSLSLATSVTAADFEYTLRLTPDLTQIAAAPPNFVMDVPFDYLYSLTVAPSGDITYTPQARSLWIVNDSPMFSYDVALMLNPASLVARDLGFFTVDYPKGTVVGPSSTIPIALHWIPNVSEGLNNITKIETPQALKAPLLALNKIFSRGDKEVQSYLSREVTDPIDGTIFEEYHGGHILKTLDINCIPLQPIGYKSDSFLRSLELCDENGNPVDFWRLQLDDFYERDKWFETLSAGTEKFITAPVHVRNIATVDQKINVSLTKSVSHPLLPLCDVQYPVGNIIPVGEVLMVEAIIKIAGTLSKLGYMNLKRDIIIDPFIETRKG